MEELSYVIVTPYSMRKSRTGGIVARLISRTGLDVVAGRMFAPSAELVNRYAETIVTETQPRHRATRSEEHTSELQSPDHLVCRLLLEKKKNDKSIGMLSTHN